MSEGSTEGISPSKLDRENRRKEREKKDWREVIKASLEQAELQGVIKSIKKKKEEDNSPIERFRRIMKASKEVPGQEKDRTV